MIDRESWPPSDSPHSSEVPLYLSARACSNRRLPQQGAKSFAVQTPLLDFKLCAFHCRDTDLAVVFGRNMLIRDDSG
jgi:hypothetical protein